MAKTKAELLERARELGVNDVDENTTNADLEARIADAESSSTDPEAPGVEDGAAADPADDVDPAQAEAEDAGVVPTQAEAAAALGQDVGYIGTSPDPFPNEAYSQESDPTRSPGALEAQDAAAEQAAAAADADQAD